MVIENDSLVTIAVKMYDLQGNLLEQTEPQGVSYLHGHGDIFAGIETALAGRLTGSTVSVVLEPEQAFGEFDPEAIYMVDVNRLGDPELIVPGLVFTDVPGETTDGRRYVVSEVAQGQAILDANHPLAGWTLRFDVTVLGVEPVDPAQSEAVGNDEVVVPDFLGFAEKIVDEDLPEGNEDALLDDPAHRGHC